MQTIIPQEHSENIYTVSRLTNEVRFLLEDSFPFVWVEGEISNFAAPHSGHWYFSLKDATAQVRCAMFRGNQRKLNFTPKDGAHVLIKARVSLYEARGEFQLIAEDMEERGEGRLRRAFELLKKKLESAGLFEAAHKKALPLFPQQIGVITSATGAAIRDILTVLKRRLPSVPIIIYPSLVQGETAASSIVKALQIANRRKECDLIILARGGGSLEDLWPFNEEIVAHAIFQSELPIISGIGHEIDFTIADFVADKRAPTPSAAAEMATPERAELLQSLAQSEQLITRRLANKFLSTKQHIAWVYKHLEQQHPKRRLSEKIQQLDFCELALTQLQTRQLAKLQSRLKEIGFKLQQQTPLYRIQVLHNQIDSYLKHINHSIFASVVKYQNQLTNAAAKLDALSPLATLKRGYAIVSLQDDRILKNTQDVQVGDNIKLRLSQGGLLCRVERKH